MNYYHSSLHCTMSFLNANIRICKKKKKKKKAEHWRIEAFKLWCWRRLLRVLWTARKSNQSILKEINPDYLLEGLMLKLNFQYFAHLMQRAYSLEKTLILGKIEGRRRRGWQRMRASSTQWTWVWASSGRWWRMGKSGMLQSMGSQRVRHYWATEQQPLCKSTMKSVETIFWTFIFSWLVICSLILSYDGRQVSQPQFLASWVMHL